MTKSEILITLQGWFLEKTGQEADPTSRYLETTGIDSFAVIGLIAFIEETFSIRFQAEDFQKEEFFTLNGLAHLIAEAADG